MRYCVRHVTKYSYTDPVPVCHNIVHLAPRTLPNQDCEHFELTVDPSPNEHSQHEDLFGNHVHYFAIQDPHHTLTLTSSSQVSVRPSVYPDESPTWETVVGELRRSSTASFLDAYQFTFPSTYAKPSDELSRYARQSFTSGRNIVDAVLDLTRRIHDEFEYDAKATTVSTPVSDVFGRRKGVCQDFAHLQIASLRALGVPARYVSGYLRTNSPPGQPRLVGSDASHAWLSVFCGDAGWIDVDPTNNVMSDVDHITLSWGRDYQDVCPVRGVFIGGGRHRLEISVEVEPTSPAAPRGG